MKKLLSLLLTLCFSAYSQTKCILYLDRYDMTSPELCQIIKTFVIDKLSDKDICYIGARETKQGKRVWISADEKGGLIDENIKRIKGYMMLFDRLFLIIDNPEDLPINRVGTKLRYECRTILPTLDGGKEWVFLISNNKYYLVRVNLVW